MKKSKVLSVVLASALVSSVVATAAISASAACKNIDDIKNHFVGVTGDFNGWDKEGDVELKDDDGDGVWEAIVTVDKVTDGTDGTINMIQPWKVDDVIQEGKNYLQFKVRLDHAWDDSWGNYEPLNDRTNNSQSNIPVVEAKVGEPISFKVIFDTTKIDQGYLNNPDSDVSADDPVDLFNIGVTYEIIETGSSAGTTTESSEETKTESSEETKTESSEETSTAAPATVESSDTTTVSTGDTTSAIALMLVVLASLGTAVVMTKKASKE